jgi:phosphatidylinositol glycan class O
MNLLSLLLGPSAWWDLLWAEAFLAALCWRLGCFSSSNLFSHLPFFVRRLFKTMPNFCSDLVPWTPPNIHFADLISIFLFSTRFFFVTGHGSDFNMISVSAGFIGIEEFSFFASGFLVALHTFSAEWLSVLMICVISSLIAFRDSPNQPLFSSWQLISRFSLLHFCRVVFTTINVMIQRRHLMVWAIFAPKFVFDLCKLAAFDGFASGLVFLMQF